MGIEIKLFIYRRGQQQWSPVVPAQPYRTSQPHWGACNNFLSNIKRNINILKQWINYRFQNAHCETVLKRFLNTTLQPLHKVIFKSCLKIICFVLPVQLQVQKTSNCLNFELKITSFPYLIDFMSQQTKRQVFFKLQAATKTWETVWRTCRSCLSTQQHPELCGHPVELQQFMGEQTEVATLLLSCWGDSCPSARSHVKYPT